MYVKFKFVYGPDWKAVGGPDQGTSQTSRKGSTDDDEVVWNFPIDVALKATSAYGWPRLVLSVRVCVCVCACVCVCVHVCVCASQCSA